MLSRERDRYQFEKLQYKFPSQSGVDVGQIGMVEQPPQFDGIEKRRKALNGPDFYEKLLAFGSITLFVIVAISLIKGIAQWAQMPPLVWGHLALVLVPLAITPVQLFRRRGDRAHAVLGWVWAVCLFITAMLSFGIRGINDGQFSFIHVLSVVTVATVPFLVWSARTGKLERHRSAVRGLVTGALLTAGFFTLIPGRLLGEWLLS